MEGIFEMGLKQKELSLSIKIHLLRVTDKVFKSLFNTYT